jgi:hypothetical protein
MSDAPQGENPMRVTDGSMPMTARVISLVLRPELGGWRVHNIGYPADPTGLPRTWQLNTDG